MRFLNVGDKNAQPEVGKDYELFEITLMSPKIDSGGSQVRKAYSLNLVYSQFSIFEDIYSNCLTGSLSIVDGNSILTEFPIIGDETVQIAFRSLNTPIGIKLRLRVTGISSIVKISDNIQTYTLHLTTAPAIQSERQKISRSFKHGKTHEIVRYICEKYLNLKDEMEVEFVQTGDYYVRQKDIEEEYYTVESLAGHVESYVAPYQSPFKIINTLCKRSINSDGVGYLFFQDINRFRLTSIEHLFSIKRKQKLIRKLVYFPDGIIEDKTQNDLTVSWLKVDKYVIKNRFDVLRSLHDGMYGSDVTFLDIEKHDFINKSYRYERDSSKFHHVSDKFLLHSKSSDLMNTETDVSTGVKLVVPFHQGDEASCDFSIHKDEIFQRELAVRLQMKAIVIEVEISGDSSGDIEIGDVVEFLFPSDISADQDQEEADIFLSGRYLVSRIHHHVSIDENYRMIVELISDTINSAHSVDNGAEDVAIKVDSKDTIVMNQDVVDVETSEFSKGFLAVKNYEERARILRNAVTG